MTKVCEMCGREGYLWMSICQDCTYREIERARKVAASR